MKSFLQFIAEEHKLPKLPFPKRLPLKWWNHGTHIDLYHGTHERNLERISREGIRNKDPVTGMVSTTPDPHTAHGYAAMSGAGGEAGFRRANGRVKASNTPEEHRAVVHLRIPREWHERHVCKSLGGNIGDAHKRMTDPKTLERSKHHSEHYATTEVRYDKEIPPEFIVGYSKKS